MKRKEIATYVGRMLRDKKIDDRYNRLITEILVREANILRKTDAQIQLDMERLYRQLDSIVVAKELEGDNRQVYCW